MPITEPATALGGIVTALRTGFGRNLDETVLAGAIAAGLPVDAAPGAVVTEDDIADLPGIARRYLHFMGVVGLRRDSTLSVHCRGRFRMRPRLPWMPYESRQINTADPVARIYHLRVDVGPVPMIAADTLIHGQGSMKGSVLGLVPVLDSSGPEMDVGELVTWLNDAVLLAPTMLLRDGVEWADVDDRSFGVTVTAHDVQATARVVVNADGSPRTFETYDRYVDLGKGLERARWATPVSGWTTVGGHRQFSSGAAVWELPGGDFAYARIRLGNGDIRHSAVEHRR